MIQVFDNFIADPERVRQSAIQSGFGTWKPNKGDTGAAYYEGMNFWGDHAPLIKSLCKALGKPIYPNAMFFRVTNPTMEHAYVHSDRSSGDYTALVYLSRPVANLASGTGFYSHRETGMIDMPPLEELMKDKAFFDRFYKQMTDADDKDWKLYKFVEAKYNRCVVFDAPKFHCRIPKLGYGTDESDSRMVWATHFCA